MIFRSPYPDVTAPEMAFTDFILERARQYGDRPALIDGPTGRTITYRQLTENIEKVAANLAKRGFKKGDVFAIFSPNLPEYAVIFHGVVLAGGIATTINPLYTVEEVAFQLNDTKARFLFTIPQFMPTAIEAARKAKIEEIFVLGEAEGATPFAALLQEAGPVPKVEIDPHQDLVALPYSSGTTGFPKGVMLSHFNFVSQIIQLKGFSTAQENENRLALLPFFHAYGLVIIMNGGLYDGVTLVTIPRFDFEQFLQLLEKYRVREVNLVPPIVIALAKHPLVDKYDLSALQQIGCGAAPLGEEVEQACGNRLGCKVFQGYGMTETTVAIAIMPREEGKAKTGSAGVLIPNMECKVVDFATGDELGADELGEIWVRGPNVMQGYLNQPEATAHTLAEGWLHTGDIGYVDDEGYFFIVDRIKELIKYKGMQVAPAELEAILLSHPMVADVAVISSPDEEAGEIPKAFVVLKGEINPDDIMAFVAERVAPHKKIRKIEIINQIPKSASGKILRRVLIEQERSNAASVIS